MKKLFGRYILSLMGWKFSFSNPVRDYKHCVIIAAPHTSNWDLPISLLTLWYMGVNPRFFIKDSYTKSWYGFIFTSLGALGVDRTKSNNLVEYTANLMIEMKPIAMVVPTEGTRNRVEKWKLGFYHIALKANVPICLAFLDYEKKVAGIGKIINPLDKIFEETMLEIEDFYKDIKGKHPELYNPKIF